MCWVMKMLDEKKVRKIAKEAVDEAIKELNASKKSLVKVITEEVLKQLKK